MDRRLLLDTASLYFRAFFGVPDSIRAPDGTPVNAVRGLLDFMTRLISEYRPTEVACCWDNDWRPEWRVELLPSYKTHRVAEAVQDAPDVEVVPDPLETQVPIIEDVLAALGVAVVGVDGYEADDVIGTLATDAPMPVDVVTGDRDLFQLVDDDREVRVLYTARGVGKHERIDDGFVRRKYGIHAEQYADFATLRGDPSDGLPGVAGVGEKTAASLLTKHRDLAGILAAVDDPASGLGPTVRQRIRDAADYLTIAPQVVGVARDLDLADVDLTLPRPAPADPEAFDALVERWGLGGSATRVVDAINGSTS
jgi:5'-3' exonuclease